MIQVADSVVVTTPAVAGWADAFRVYIMPALSTLLMGLVAILLEWIRRIMSTNSARTLVAAANAKIAADNAAVVGQTLHEEADKHWQELQVIKEVGLKTHELVNSAADKAQRQIDRLTEQLQQADIKPKKGNGSPPV